MGTSLLGLTGRKVYYTEAQLAEPNYAGQRFLMGVAARSCPELLFCRDNKKGGATARGSEVRDTRSVAAGTSRCCPSRPKLCNPRVRRTRLVWLYGAESRPDVAAIPANLSFLGAVSDVTDRSHHWIYRV